MRARSCFAAAALLMLPGCQPPVYEILAVASRGQVAFTAIDHSSWDGDSLYADRLQVRDRERIVWLIAARGNCRVPETPWPFPLVYGRVPPCFEEVVPARPLREGVLYRVEGDGLRAGSGYFRLQQAARNFDWEEVGAETGSWPPLNDPRYPISQTPAAPAAAESNATAR